MRQEDYNAADADYRTAKELVDRLKFEKEDLEQLNTRFEGEKETAQ